jgi:phage-related minor tail protein
VADREIVYRLRADNSAAEQATERFDAALASVERTLGSVAQQLGAVAANSATFERSQQSATVALRNAAEAEKALVNIRAAAQDRERAAYQSQQQFIAGLQRQADGLGKTRSELLAMQAAELGVSAQAAPLIARLAATEKGVAGVGRTGKLTAFEVQQLGYQVNDFAVQVASGQSVITAFVQQGSQLSGTFGGMGGALRAVGSLFTLTNVAIAAGTAVLGTYAFALYEGHQQSKAFEASVELNGNAAGVTAGRVDALASSISANARVTAGAAREITQAFVGAGQVTGDALQPAIEAAARLQRLTGTSADEIAKDFAGMSQGVAKWAVEHNRQYNYLTAEQYKYIRSLEAQGRTEEAMRVNAEALNEALAKRTRNLGYLEAAWDGVKRAASGAWDAMLAVGRDATPEEKVAQAIARLANARRAAGDAASIGPYGGPRPSGAEVAAKAEAELRFAFKQLEIGQQNATALKDKAAKNQREIREAEKAHQEALLSLEGAGFAQRQAQQERNLSQASIAYQRAFDEDLISAQGYAEARAAIERASLAAREVAINEEIALEKKRPPENPTEAVSQRAKTLELETRRIALLKERDALEEKIRRGELVPVPKDRSVGPSDALRRFQAQDNAAVEEGLRQRREQAFASDAELLRANRDMNIALIRDDQARGMAQIALDEQELRKRLDLGALNTDDRKAVEEDLAQWRALRERQLTEELKPEWQRQLELFDDTQRYMRQASADFHQSFIDGGRDAWTEFLKTGKLSADKLADILTQSLARISYDKLLAKPLAGAADQLFSWISGAFTVRAQATQSQVRAVDNAIAAKEELVDKTALAAVNKELVSTTGAVDIAFTAVRQAADDAAVALQTVAASGSGAPGGAGIFAKLFGNGPGGTGLEGMSPDDLSYFYASKNGNVFTSAGMQAFAKGSAFANSVVSEPQAFAFAKGTKVGVMGEAGPEAIVPLTRGPGGVLGVRNFSGQQQAAAQPVVNNFQVITPPGFTAEKTERRNSTGGVDVIAQIKQIVASDFANHGEISRAAGARFGLSSAAGAPIRGRV